ncbi:flagellar hook-length control protein FliK [Paenisporosarcina cavernae]|uniref:Flagellar hook-length control protein FliK n=1 Tax=Paenisporosarcina cavernae TaxID=2320858 RepID=A0A385YRX0_9BACL|nr:flagellar hook-length control protein FliK [Paenisporosarcina cavernae]AYC29244.1 flagellar hook-length control protein FliK [Paenisporosarcina cavernae]
MITQLSTTSVSKTSTSTTSTSEVAASSKKVNEGTQKSTNFKSVFKQIHQSAGKEPTPSDSTSTTAEKLGEVQDILQADSIEDLFGALGLPTPPVSELESITLESLSDMLGLKVEEVSDELKDLLDVTELPNSLMELVQIVEKEMPAMLTKLTESLTNVSATDSKGLSQVLQVIKAAELILPKTDLLWKQELAVFQLKDLMKKLESAMQQVVSKQNAQPAQTRLAIWNTSTSVHRTTEVHVTETQIVQKTVQQTEQSSSTLNGQLPQTKTETVTITLPTVKAAQSESFVKEFQAIMNRSQFGQAGGTTKMLIKLYPEHLGTIRVELVSRDGVMSARLLANTSLGKEMLDSSLHQLKQAFHQQALQVDRIDVSQALQDSNRQEKQSFNGAFQQRSQQNDTKQEEESQEDTSFQDVLMEMEV